MILASLIILSTGMQAPAVTCSILGGPAALNGPAVDYKGVRYQFCCNTCQGAFDKDPEKAITADRNKGKTIGTALFDPISGSRISKKDSKATEDYNGVRYYFASDDEKTKFDGDPAKFTVLPAKESLYCPVQKDKTPNISEAGAYADYNGVRYYFCCGMCPGEFAKDPGKYAPTVAAHVTDAKPQVVAQELVQKQAMEDVKAPAAAAGNTTASTASHFNCKHCGRPMTANSPDDMSKTCNVCGCGNTYANCKGGKK